MSNPLANPGYVDPETAQQLAAFTQKLKQRLLAILDLGPGQQVLDVGCGPGIHTLEIARRVEKTGCVVGIDYDPVMIGIAHQRAQTAGVDSWTTHIPAAAARLPFRANSFDASQSERLFQHVDDGAAVLDEMIRVTRYGGKITVADSDWCTLSIDTPETEIERRIVRFLPDLFRNGYAGRQLYRLFKERRLADVQVEAHPIIWTDWKTFRATSFSIKDLNNQLVESGTVTEEELQHFLTSLEDAQRRGVFFASGNIILVIGIKSI